MVPAAQPSQQAVQVPHSRAAFAIAAGVSSARGTGFTAITAPQHFLNFLPLPQGQGSFRPTLMRALHHADRLLKGLARVRK